jgi:phosphoribosylanthranilate isomerase
MEPVELTPYSTTDNGTLFTNSAASVWAKCCGLTRLEDVQHVALLGYEFAGCIRVPNTPRYMEQSFLQAMAKDLSQYQTVAVAVYADASVESILEDVMACPSLHAVQLHGSESTAYIHRLREALPASIHVWKAVNLLFPPATSELLQWAPYIDVLLMDLPKSGAPGAEAARDFSWETVAPDTIQACMDIAMVGGFQICLAGKLHAGTVPLLLKRFQPHGIDAASGVEDAPGQKNVDALKALRAAIVS